jgi:hypothetical protein
MYSSGSVRSGGSNISLNNHAFPTSSPTNSAGPHVSNPSMGQYQAPTNATVNNTNGSSAGTGGEFTPGEPQIVLQYSNNQESMEERRAANIKYASSSSSSSWSSSSPSTSSTSLIQSHSDAVGKPTSRVGRWS